MGLDIATTCEVFDFTSNSWRYVVPASPHRIIACREPLFCDGSLHLFTEGEEETKVLFYHLHSETFQLISNAPLPFVDHVHPEDVAMCTLNNRFCVSQKTDLVQVIWSFDSSNNKTWVKLYSIDLNKTSSWFGTNTLALSALAVPATTKFLLYDSEYNEHKQQLVLHDPENESYDLVFTAKSIGLPLCYYQSLISNCNFTVAIYFYSSSWLFYSPKLNSGFTLPKQESRLFKVIIKNIQTKLQFQKIYFQRCFKTLKT